MHQGIRPSPHNYAAEIYRITSWSKGISFEIKSRATFFPLCSGLLPPSLMELTTLNRSSRRRGGERNTRNSPGPIHPYLHHKDLQHPRQNYTCPSVGGLQDTIIPSSFRQFLHNSDIACRFRSWLSRSSYRMVIITNQELLLELLFLMDKWPK